MNTGSIRRGFASGNIRPRVNTGTLLPAGKHATRIIAAEYETPAENPSYKRHQGDKQLKLLLKNALGIISVWLNALGFVRTSELKSMTAADLPTDIDYKAIGTTKSAFDKMSITAKWNQLCTTSPQGYAVRKDTMERIISEKHSDEAASFAGSCLGAAGLTEDDNFDENSLPSLLVGRTIGVKVSERSFEGDDKLKVTGFFIPNEEQVSELAEIE